MQLDKFQAVAKKRTGWEALDLGCVLARSWFLVLWFTWIIPAGCCLALLSLIFNDHPSIAGAITWLLKPVWERPLLFIASRKIFSEDINRRDIFQNYLSCNKRDWLWWVTLRRLSPLRAFSMPVTVLEGLKGKPRSNRINLLQRRCSSPATWMLISGVHIEFFISLALTTAFILLLPRGIEIEWERFLFVQPTITYHLYNLVWLVSASLVAPFYVCAGFTLYLQRRIDLEGWDIEIQLRQLAQRMKKTRKNRKTTTQITNVVASLFLASSFIMMATPNIAQADNLSENTGTQTKKQSEVEFSDNEFQEASINKAIPLNGESSDETPSNNDGNPFSSDSHAKREAKQRIHDILSQPPFYNEKTDTLLAFKPQDEDTGLPEWLMNLAQWLDDHGGVFSSIAKALTYIAKTTEVLLWSLALFLVLFVLWRYREWIRQSLLQLKPRHTEESISAPKTLFGIDLNDDHALSNSDQDALKIWQQGLHRQAFSLLLRQTLLASIKKGCVFKDGYTENECAYVVKHTLEKAHSLHFSALIQCWQQLAYAHRPCSDDQFAQLFHEHNTLWIDE